jgi:hypothetical protein
LFWEQFAFSLVSAAITASLAAWLTATLALRRFRSEKVWERKAEAYTATFQALHTMSRWYDEHWSAMDRGLNLPDRFVARILGRWPRASWWSHQPIRMVAGIPKLVIRFSALHPIFASTC